jgi:hypothetical protein
MISLESFNIFKQFHSPRQRRWDLVSQQILRSVRATFLKKRNYALTER